ncbi:MAG: hypothetical protein KY445_07850 [Armatimonadetes bacterium]|nr:hypothetical protein [Armatimonadota bacterium]
MWIKITPKKQEDQKTAQLRALGALGAPEIHVNSNDISTISFGEKVAQIRLSSGKIIDTKVAEEIAELQRLVTGESIEAYETILQRLPKIFQRSAMEVLAEYMAEDAAKQS